MAISSNGQLLAAATTALDDHSRIYSEIATWEIATGHLVSRLKGYTGFPQDNHGKNPVARVGFSPDSRFLGFGDGDGALRVWDLQESRWRALLGQDEIVEAVTFNPELKMVAGKVFGGDIVLWRFPGQERIGSLRGGWPIEFSPDGTLLACRGSLGTHFPGTIHLWDISELKGSRVLGPWRTFEGSESAIACLAFSPDGEILAGGSKDTVILWDVDSGKTRARIRAHTGGFVRSVSFSSDGVTMASAGDDGTVKIWNLTNIWRECPYHS